MTTTAAVLQSIRLIHQQHFVNDWNGRLMFSVDPGGFSRVEELDICQMYKPPKEGKKDDSYHKECLINSEKACHGED
eukprot:5940580-Ditylum_brightwellii.AAC.1